MTITNNIVAKLAVAFVAVAMVFSAFAASAKAQTTEDLQQMINDLLAQVAALQSQAGQGATSAAGVCPYTWTRDLSSGSTGGDVMKLQQFLNADPDTRVAVEGAGSAGMETEYYGPATAAAVSKLQVKYRSEVLSPANLVNPTGYFGPSSRTKANGLCVSAPVMDDSSDDMMDDEDDMMDDSDDADFELSGEASLDKFETDSASDDQIEEGAEDAEIATVTVEFADGDAEISRLDLALESSDVTESDPWDTFETISLWVDGDKIAEKSADSRRNDYLDEDFGTLRFSGLDLVAMEDEEVEIVVAATVQNSVDGTADGNDWTVEFDAIRYFDADGVASTDTTTGDLGDPTGESFTIEESGYEDELKAKTSSNDPDATTLQVNDDSKSDWYTVFVFDLDTDNSVNDIELNSIKVNVATTGATYSTLVDDAELVIDGTTIDDVTVVATGNVAVLTFDVNGDVVIDAGDRVEAELMLRFKSLDPSDEGSTVKGSISSLTTSIVDAEGADDLGNSQLSGSATGEQHTLRTAGADVEAVSVDADVTVGDNNTDDYGTYVIKFEVTAFEQDVFVPIAVASSVSYTLQDGSGSTSVAGSRSVTLTSTADEGGAGDAFFEVNEGSTETFTLTVTYTPGVANTASRMVLNSITFDETGTAVNTDDQTQVTVPASDFRTDVITMVN